MVESDDWSLLNYMFLCNYNITYLEVGYLSNANNVHFLANF